MIVNLSTKSSRETIEIENYHFQEYEGNYTDYIQKKKLRKKELDRQFEWEEELLIMESEAIDSRSQQEILQGSTYPASWLI